MDPLPPERALEVLEAARVAHVGVISQGEPYVTPITYVVEGSRLRFRTAPGRRLEAIEEAAARICVEAYVMDEAGSWESIVAWGSGSIEDDPGVIQDTIGALYSKYEDLLGDPMSVSGLQPAIGAARVVTVELESVTGMTSGSGLRPRTRPGRL